MQTTQQEIERVLEKVQIMSLPENEHIFDLHVHEENNIWFIGGCVGPYAHTIADGQPYPVLCPLPVSDLEFTSKEEALEFAQEVHDVLSERGLEPDASTFRLLERQSV